MQKMKLVPIICMLQLVACMAFSQDKSSSIGLIRELYNKGQYAQATALCEKWQPMITATSDKRDTLFLSFCELSGQCYFASGQYEKALQTFQDLMSVHGTSAGSNQLQYAADLSNVGGCYIKMGNFTAAIPMLGKAKSIIQEVLGEKHPGYARILNELADLCYSMGNVDSALILYREAALTDKAILGNKSPEYAADLNNLGQINKSKGNYDSAIVMLQASAAIYMEISWTQHPDYANTLNNLAGCYKVKGNYKAALPFYQEAKNIRYQALGGKHPEYAASLNNLALLYIRLGNYEAALPLYQDALAIFKETVGPKHTDYARTLNNLASLYNRMGINEAALPLYKEALSIYKETLGDKSTDYATSLSNLALLYTDLGNIEAAFPLLKEAAVIDKEVLGAKHIDYAADLINMANQYSAMRNFDTALLYLTEACSIHKEVSGARHRDYALSLNSLARLHKSMGHYETALNLLLEAKSIYQESLGIKHPDYAISLKNLGLLYKDMGNYDAALPLLVEVIGIRKEALGYNHPEYAFSLKSLASLYLAMGNYTTALPLWEEANLIINHNVQDNFSFLTQNEKEIYFSKVGDIYDVYLSFLKKDIATSAQYCGQAYNNELLLKGLILTSVAGMQQAVLASGDTSLTRPYEEMRVLKRQITAEQQKPITKRRSDLTAIELRCKELEEDLTRRSQAFGRMQSSFKLKWQDVQDQLGENEASIEFVSFRYFGDRKITDSTYYYAFVLRRHDPSPQLVYLCEETELTNAIPPLGAAVKDINILYQGQALHKLVWQPLDTLLEGVKTVYYAPSGLLNSVSMAAICGPDRKMLMEKYELVQLSSTRSLAMTRKPDSITDAVVYGGIAYDTDTLTLLTKTESYNQKECDALTSVRSIAGSTRNGFRYLPGAEREARIVLSKLANKGIASKRYFGTDAVEESFVALSGRNSPSLIHLSTHGFYYPDTTEGKQHSRIPPLATGEARFRYSNDPLIRSGLLMAGANIAWKGLPLPQHIEDGILTAKEVSNMNLMNTQLVVLSACQTGQGDVKGNEGVEGLQRGFKMAGVRYLIMSLWEVPDKETTEFMESFYDNFLGGKEIHDAFRTAQAKMRNDYKNEPFKWAAFVLME